MSTSEPRRLGFLAGLLLFGYGALVLLDVLAHESLWVGAGLIVVGLGLLVPLGLSAGTSRGSGPRPRQQMNEETSGRTLATLLLGFFAAGGVLSYNLAAGASWTSPKLALLAYGIALLAAAPDLHRPLGPVRVGSLVAWSLPLLGAPLGIWAFDAALDAGAGASPLDAFIEHALVPPMEASLTALGFEVANHGQTLSLQTPRGELFLTVGLVCAGIQPGILFLGLLGLDAWKRRTSPRRFGGMFLIGIAAVYLVNMVRLVGLAIVGHRWGGDALQTVHAHGGWVLFLVLVLVFWGLILPLTDRVAEKFKGRARGKRLEA